MSSPEDLPPLLAGMQLAVGPGLATITPSIDMETYSEAGYVWDEAAQKWRGLPGSGKKGLKAVGHRKYAQHPSAEVLTFTYDLRDGLGQRRWKQGDRCPIDLARYIATGGIIESHNAGFEVSMWSEVLVPRHGFPPIPLTQWRCSAAKARAWGMPSSLEKLGEVLQLPTQKDAEGKRLMKKFSMPRDPTKADSRRRIMPSEDPEEFERYCQYCDTDEAVEGLASARVPDLIPIELAYWQCDLAINYRGVGVDVPSVENCIKVVDQVLEKYGRECAAITGGLMPSQVQALIGWLAARGVRTKSLDAESLEELLARQDLPADARRVIELRALTGSASVKKVYGMAEHATHDARLHDLFVYHGARTGRDTHADIQPGNLPKAGPALRWCDNHGCHKPYAKAARHCPWCGTSEAFSKPAEWSYEAVPYALEILASQSVDAVEYFFGDALLTISGCVRSLLKARPGYDLVCSDYSAIEAVVLAALAGEQWRLDSFAAKDDIYLRGASAITGTPYEEYIAYAKQHGHKHPDRQAIGKVSELALGYLGGLGAWRNFDKSDRFTDKEVKAIVQKWRQASPNIVEFGGGQLRGKPWAPERYELYGLEGMAIAAILSPGEEFHVGPVSWQMFDDVLYCKLPSGRRMAYHQPRLQWAPPDKFPDWAPIHHITYMTWNSNVKMGPLGWVRMDTFAGRLAENVTSAVARDVMANAVINLEAAGYAVVLRIHDELVSEIPKGWGSAEEFERIMGTLPAWAEGWPIRCGGTWKSERFHKD